MRASRRTFPRAFWTLTLGVMVGGVFCAATARADVFILKDGSRLEGTAVAEGGVLVITTYAGRVVRVPQKDVMGSRKDPQRNAYHRRARLLKPDDAAGHYRLALWAQSKKLAREAKDQFKLVLKADPFHEGAGKALGYKQLDGRWVPPGTQNLRIGPRSRPGARPSHAAETEARRLVRELKTLDFSGSSESAGSEHGPALTEMLARARKQPALFARVLKAPGKRGHVRTADAVIRAKAARILGLAGDRRAMQPLLDACFEDPDDRVRWSAAKALPPLEEPVALRKLVDAAVSGKLPWLTRKLACIAIRRYGDKEGIERLLKEVSFELASGNARDSRNKLRGGPHGLGTENPMGLPTSPPPMPTRDMTLLYPALSALKEVTGVSFDADELDFKTWKRWWKKNRASFKFKD